jgi:mycothiol S-conjugate amidase
VVTTYDENGGYPHPDHVMTHNISLVAFDAAGDPERYPGAGEPWQPLKLYYHLTFTKARVLALHEAMVARDLDSPYAEWLEHWSDEHDLSARVTTRVPCGEWFERRDAALVAHATQVDPNGRWFATPMDLQREVWPTEDYELARSLVNSTPPEDDLFAGIRERIRV